MTAIDDEPAETNRARDTRPVLRDPPSAAIRDLVLAVAGCVPGIGSFAQYGVAGFWKDPSQAATRRFLIEVAERVTHLESRGDIDIVATLAKPETPPLLLRAIDAARKSVGERKLVALREATVHGVFERVYPFDLTAMVFELLDRITERHLDVLTRIRDFQRAVVPMPVNDALMIGVTVSASPEGMKRPAKFLAKEDEFYDQYDALVTSLVLDDLLSMGLIEPHYQMPRSINEFSTDPSKNLPKSYGVTDRGRLFFDVIEESVNDTEQR